MMARLRRADEIVVRDVQVAAHLAEAAGDLLRKDLRLQAGLLRRAFDFLTVLIRPRQKEHVVAEQPPRARDRIREHRRVRVTDVRLRVDVVNGRRDVERIHERRASSHAFVAAAWMSFTLRPDASASRTQSSNSGEALSTSPSRLATLNRTCPNGVVTVFVSRSRHSRVISR